MSILVVCTGCKKRFTVSDKFAGKSGPCPNCKTVIRVPTKEEEVKIHAPTEFAQGGRGASGQLTTKPILREEFKLTPVAAVAICGAVLAVLLITWVLGRTGSFQQSAALRVVGLILVSPPLVVAGYSFLQDEEDLDPLRGRALYGRGVVCGLIYAGLWGIYAYIDDKALTGEIWIWLFVVPPFFVVGSLVAVACLGFDFGTGLLHYSFYVLVTVLLGWLAGLGWVWDLPEESLLLT